MSYTFNIDDAFSFLKVNNIEFRRHGDELEAKYCPYCYGGGGRDQYTFSLNMEKGVFNCLRASCGKQGHFVELCRDFEYPLEFEERRVYKALPQPTQPILSTEPALKYLENRGISAEIGQEYEITSTIKRPDVLIFPFFDENGKLQFIKYRDTKFQKGKSKGSKECRRTDRPCQRKRY